MHGPSLASVEEKLKDIYDDLASNVTHIYNRQDLHFMIDLTYHSPLRFVYDGKIVRKGYCEVLICGDSRTGKTQCAEALQAHYGVGITAGGESMSFAGLVGGCQQLGKHWSVTWGKIPQNNRRLVIIDEAGGMTAADIGKMSRVRSQGKAEITKIQSQETEAWTRLIWLANPRDTMTVNEFSSGIDLIETLIASPEDIARWDAILIVSKDEIPFGSMVNSDRPPIPHKYTSELCKNLVLFAWTREVKEITFTKEAENACFRFGEAMCKKYCSNFMLVNDAEQRIKLARMATALAARLYSTTDGKNLIVHGSHVHYIYKFLNRVYDSKYFKYDQWSTNQVLGSQILDTNEVIQFCLDIGKYGCMKFHELKGFRVQEIENYLGISYDEAKAKLSKLLLNNALTKSKGDFYKKSPAFNSILAKYAEQAEAPTEKEF